MIEKNVIWVEKYRPKEVSDLILEPDTREILNQFLLKESIPHLLLSGNVGCGKTTIAKILLSKLDCDSLVLNASDERGIETVRNKIKNFAMMSGLKKLKVVFLDEADNLTPESQFAMRNMMETYAEQTRFVLTCNYVNRIIEPIRSRCQFIEFKNLQRKSIRVLLEKILNQEGITYLMDDLLVMIDLYYPDIRSMINNLELFSVSGKWSLKDITEFRDLDKLIPLIKKGGLHEIRELSLDYTGAYKFLFDKVEELTDNYGKIVEISILISEYMYRAVFVPDKSINFSACCLSIMEKLGIVYV